MYIFRQILASRRRLPQPKNCPIEIYEIMVSGWDVPERRFPSLQHIFSTLMTTRKLTLVKFLF